jgi:hypothetical protein
MLKRTFLILITLILFTFLVKFGYGIATAPPLGANFPQTIKYPTVYLDTPSIKGKLILDHGCLRVSGVKNLMAGDNFLLIWNPKFSTLSVQGVVQIIDSATGEILAKVDDYVVIGDGGTLKSPAWFWLKQPIPNECPGPYWLVGEFLKKIEAP